MTHSAQVLERFRLDGRTAIVTGAGPGIGAHVARAFAAVGANVVVTARTPGKAEGVAAQIREDGGQALGLESDCAKPEDLEVLVERTHANFGPVHVLFHNAFAGPMGLSATIWDTTDDTWEMAFAVNVLAPFRLARMLVPDMKREGYGSIINVLSTAGFTPIFPHAAYGATKSALETLSRYLAKEVGPDVRVNCLCPGTISPDGSMREAWLPHIETTAVKRVGLADEVVGAALLLASPASSYTTGQTIFCDGGRVGTIS